MFPQKGTKRQLFGTNDGSSNSLDEIYRFKVLLPNGTTVGLNLRESGSNMGVNDFINLVKDEYSRLSESMQHKRCMNWDSAGSLSLHDANDAKIKGVVDFKNFKPHKCHILILHDGSGKAVQTFENMWDLTPDTDILREVPESYTFESALADLIDNSLQAVWANSNNDRKLVSVDLLEDRISVFDSGIGMDGSDENSLAKWYVLPMSFPAFRVHLNLSVLTSALLYRGKMGASLNRSEKEQAIGGNPPYLMPYFGMFGYGGSFASMHLGRHALVSSKTKNSRKVYTLRLAREALLRRSGLEWTTSGGLRDPSEDELTKTKHGSFTKVEIFEPKIKPSNILQLQCKLKDIYFPYIQCDELSNSRKTITPIEFQVNGTNLTEIEGGEVAITNLHSCNGPDFVLQLRLSFNQDNVTKSQVVSGSRLNHEANVRLKCVYFPVVGGKENIEKILEKLKDAGHEVSENFRTFKRVSIRRLGRLIPDARWDWMPFMDLRQKKGTDRAHILKRCCFRVKCFIDTDAGINPTPSKHDLAPHSPFTTALRNFGNILYENEKVSRVHQVLKRNEITWKAGQHVKILKGACAGVHKNNVYATIQYFILGGLQGDTGGEVQIICRPLGTPEDDGCIISEVNGMMTLDMKRSLSLPISVIDSKKCLPVETAEWNNQMDKQLQKNKTVDLYKSSIVKPARQNSKQEHDGMEFSMFIKNYKKVFEDDLLKFGSEIQILEDKYHQLNEEKEKIEETIKDLQGFDLLAQLWFLFFITFWYIKIVLIEYLSRSCVCCEFLDSTELYPSGFVNQFSTKEEVIESIVKMGNSVAAAVLCSISKEDPFQEKENDLMKDIIGVVALLGRVRSSQLSRILAEYLGSDQMLAVVARSFETAILLEKHKQTGDVNCSHVNHEKAPLLGQSINGRFIVICFDNISPFRGSLKSGSQRKLDLQRPYLNDGTIPKGFLGFAVNMIDFDADQLSIKNSSGNGLRETVFYHLLGELHLYRTLEDMLAARACIKQGAISLDGGILRGDSVISFGSRCVSLFMSFSSSLVGMFFVEMIGFSMIVLSDPGVCFQVVQTINEMPSSQENLKQLKEKKSELRTINDEIEVEKGKLNKVLDKFHERKAEFNKFMKLVESPYKL
ncbi:structural maintenance of chromosomes flexible hinge domain-containing protein GMI1 isoform X4 [Cannabis sativa]|uniref:structural maintenance of chromosomes flexible hinge domain-containing protein GMI1 isoform X4 n=1 Tax=Cannabis sativa TaxID=3483 RepID=UPI0029CAA619|nr:structural maintenance of chromosomes flexible hinge domain-containing protein GMI1 isoform X4 [Cannabis sativa]